ncbi:MAG: HisA/HisF-related TIM barrel protein [Gemmatimonadota bacterium]
MLAIPAIDLRSGTCVQLVGGDYKRERIRLSDPVAVARDWSRLGFQRLHVVDLDAATAHGGNRALVEDLLREPLTVQVGGGLRSTADVSRLLDAGAEAVIVGTRAVSDFDWLSELCSVHPGHIILAVDVRERRVVIEGWQRALQTDLPSLLDEINGLELAAVMVTAVHREGLQSGTDLHLVEEVLEQVQLPLIVAGGIADMSDLRALDERGVSAAVVGMALYSGALDPAAVANEFCQ